MKVVDHFGKQPKAIQLLEGMTLVALFGILDYFTGREFAFSIFYFLPIYLVAHYTGRQASIVVAVQSAITWHLANIADGPPYSNSAIPYWNTLTRLCFFIVFVLMLGYRSRFQVAHQEATTDGLTGLLNRRQFYHLAEMELKRAGRYGRPFTAVYIDLDNFKNVNDALGHEVGDLVLRSVAATLTANVRSSDVVARLGGDEFALLLAETDAESASSYLGRAHGQLHDAMIANKWNVTFSIGAVTFTHPPKSVDEMITRADNLMYTAKRQGKNNLCHKVD